MIPYIVEAIKTQNGRLDGINTQLATQGLRIDELAGELQEMAKRLSDLEKEFKDYKALTERKIEELERRTGGTINTNSVGSVNESN
jgi:uncharacterized coiled-coil protein SlyX